MTPRLQEAVVNMAAHPLRWPLARLARSIGPVLHVPGVGVVISGAELATEVMQRDQDFTKNGKGSISAVITQLLGPMALANMDGEAHHRLRAKLGDLLSPLRVNALLDACRSPLDNMVRDLTAGQTVDLVRVMRTLSGRVAMEMIGVTPDDGTADEAARDIVSLGERVASQFWIHPLPAQRLRKIQADIDRLSGYARSSYDAKAGRDTSLVWKLRTLGASFEETRGVVSIFFVAGTLTTALSLPRIVAVLIDSGQMDRLREGGDGVARALEDGLRYVTPIPATVRIAARDVTLGKRRIRAGTRMLILTTNLTRDRRIYPNPFRFDVDRVHDSRGRHLWYGAGPHFCFGFALAQREIHRVLETLSGLPGRLCIVRRRPAFGALLPRYERLTIRLVPE
jgi:cytochrome P450